MQACYFDEIAAQNAIERRYMFQLQEFASGDKVDFWLLKDDPYDREAFSRRYHDEILGVHAALPRPEDMILRKLKWAQEYESEKQFRDALGVYELQFAKLDQAYLARWVRDLELEPIGQRLIDESHPVNE